MNSRLIENIDAIQNQISLKTKALNLKGYFDIKANLTILDLLFHSFADTKTDSAINHERFKNKLLSRS